MLLEGDLDVFVLDVEAQAVEGAHVDVGDPNESKPGHQVSAPAVVQELKTSNQQENQRDVMAEAVFARKEVEKLSPPQAVAVFTFAFAPVARLAEDFFVGDGPTDARDGDGEQQEERELMGERHGSVERIDAEKHQGATAMLLRPHPTDDEAVRRMGHP